MDLCRRYFFAKMALWAAIVANLGTLHWWSGQGLMGFAYAQSNVDSAKLLEAHPLGERSLGSGEAKVTIVEYASSTCPHCARFHTESFPVIKKNYIDTGHVKFIFREFPLNDVDLAAVMLARCAPEDKYFPLLDVYFEQQDTWTKGNPRDELFKIAQLAGFTRESFETCLKNEQVAKGLVEGRDRAEKEFGVDSTPTFFINGEKQLGARPLEEFRKLIDAALGR